MTEPTLPPLPPGHGLECNWYTADQLRAAQLAAIEPYRRDAEKLRAALDALMELERRGRVMPIGREWDAARAAMRQEGKKQ